MFFKSKLIEILNNDQAILFVDMDGVIADYDLGNPYDFKNKRPLTSNIKNLKEISALPNIELHILSICKKDFQIKEKNDWLDTHAPYFKKEYRTILSKETYPDISSKELKCNFLKNYSHLQNTKIILIDDDNSILKYIKTNMNDIILFQDSVLID